MRAGSLRHRITIEQSTQTPNDLGERIETWATLSQRWASVEPLSGRELETARIHHATVSHRITIRYYSSLQPTHRIKWGSRIFSIDAILNIDERNREMQILSTEVINP